MAQGVTPDQSPAAMAQRAPLASPLSPPEVAHRSPGGWRFVRAYSTTFLVIASYVSLGLATRLFGRAWPGGRVGGVHKRNAQRGYSTILRLQVLFHEVGQL